MDGKCRTLIIPGSLVAPVALCSCTMGWVRPNTGPEQVEQDGAECRIAAYGKYPERMVHMESDKPREPSRDEDTNALLRDEQAKYCMRQKGYAFKRVRGGT
jgi:hypothetical protein